MPRYCGCKNANPFRCARAGLAPRSTARRWDLPSSQALAFAGPFGREEIMSSQAAEKAIHPQWDKLRSRKAWDEDNPREWGDFSREARETKQKFTLVSVWLCC